MLKEKVLISKVMTLDTGNTHEVIQHFYRGLLPLIKEKILISRVITLDTGNTHEIIQHFLSRVMTLDKDKNTFFKG